MEYPALYSSLDSVDEKRNKGVLNDMRLLMEENHKELQKQNFSSEYIQVFLYGFKKGFLQGLCQTKLKNAKTMKADGMSPTLISKYTGLSTDEINKL